MRAVVSTEDAMKSAPALGQQPRRPARLLLALLAAGCLVGCATKPPETVAAADLVVVKKSERKLQLIRGGDVVREYRVALGDNPVGHKFRQGDERTPEGDYVLDWRNPNSQFYRSIHVSYPNERDRLFARALGQDPGGMIMIHGKPNYISSPRVLAEYDRRDWTNGCIAVANHEMDEIWTAVKDGTPIRIEP
jgi:murein L,D-transpeptidase YafK